MPFVPLPCKRDLKLRACALWLVLLAGGCASKRDQIAQALSPALHAPPTQGPATDEDYRIGHPDSVEIVVEGMPECSGRFPINVDGRIENSRLSNPRVDGETAVSLQRLIARDLGLSPRQVRCRALAFASQAIFVRGAIDGGDRAVAYRGPERVVDFIRRCGGLLPSANANDVQVVRANVAEGRRPQVFTVDLEGILLRGEPDTNVILHSLDEVYIGERPRAKLGRALPEFLRPIYRGICATMPALCPYDWRQQIRELPPGPAAQ